MRNVHPYQAPARLILGLALGSLLLSGCGGTGYSIRAPYDTSIKTVYVPMFKSIMFQRDVNITLTEMVCKEIERKTPYKVVQDPDRADSVLEGTISYSAKNVIVENPYNLPRQLTATMMVTATWTNNNINEEDKKPPNPAVVAETFNFYPEIGESSEAAFYRTCEKLAVQIVNMMEESWKLPGED